MEGYWLQEHCHFGGIEDKSKVIIVIESFACADNGIGVAAALALLDSGADVKLPPLECLFTVDEETGLTGAFGLDPSILSGQPPILGSPGRHFVHDWRTGLVKKQTALLFFRNHSEQLFNYVSVCNTTPSKINELFWGPYCSSGMSCSPQTFAFNFASVLQWESE